jgi:hypothetical protein
VERSDLVGVLESLIAHRARHAGVEVEWLADLRKSLAAEVGPDDVHEF